MKDATLESPSVANATDRVAAVAGQLRGALRAVVREVAGPTPRPARLVGELHVDKSLASRLVRALRADSPFAFIYFVPSPTGLRMVLDAAGAAGVDAELCAAARRATEMFQDLLDDLPGGRTSLDTLISESVVEVRERAERTAKQAVHKSMSYLLGFHCETITSALMLQPSADGMGVDGIEVSRRADVRRLRPSAPVALFSISAAANRATGPGPRLEALGRDGAVEPMAFLLPEFCAPPMPPVSLVQDNGHTIFALSEAAASVHEPVTVTSALVVRGGWITHRSPEQMEDGRSYLLHYPCKLLIRDLYIRDDLYVGAEPQIRLEFPSPLGTPRPRSRGNGTRLNTLDMSAPIENLGRGLGKTAAHGVPEHARLVDHAFDVAGWDADRFRGYRTRIIYPVPMITMGWWIPLPEAG